MSSDSPWIWQIGHSPAESTAETQRLLGGKGAALCRMMQLGLPVPPGFTIVTDACRAYWQADQNLPERLWEEVKAGVHQLEEMTGSKYAKGDTPLLLAIRSGAKHSMPGMMATLLNCGLTTRLVKLPHQSPALADTFTKLIADFARVGHGVDLKEHVVVHEPTWEQLLDQYERIIGAEFPDDPWSQLRFAIVAVLNSWNSSRVVKYRAMRGIRDRAGTAVNVQAMVPVEYSGLLFSRNPLEQARNESIIEVVHGLGDQLAAGQQTPCRYRVNRDNATDVECEPVAKQEIRGDEILAARNLPERIPPLVSERLVELLDVGRRLEREFESAVDVEWGMCDGHLVLFQVRPQPLHDDAARRDACITTELARLEQALGEKGAWVRHNLAESLPAPTPMTWDILRRHMSGRGGFGQLYRDLGYAPSRRVCEKGFLELVFGQVYADPVRMVEVFCTGLPMSYDIDRLKQDASLLDRAPGKLDPEATDAGFLFRLPQMFWVLLRSARRTRRMQQHARQAFEEHVVPQFNAYCETERSTGIRCGVPQLLELLENRISVVLDHFAPEFMKPGLFGALALARLESKLTQVLGETRGRRLTGELIQGLEVDWRSGPEVWWQHSGKADLPEFLARFGHRASNEFELAEPRWHENSEVAQKLLRSLHSSGDSSRHLTERAKEVRARAEQQLPRLLAAHGASSLAEKINRNLAMVHQLLPYREIGKHYLMLGYDRIRQVIVALADQLNLGGDIFFMRLKELQRFAAGESITGDRETASLIERRRFRWQTLQRIALPNVVDRKALEHLFDDVSCNTQDAWTDATALSNGVARGPVYSVTEESTLLHPQQTGYVLVCRTLDMGLTHLMTGACALVVERGGMLSHGAAVARQLGIPAVACSGLPPLTSGVTWLVVDGSRGRVRLERRA